MATINYSTAKWLIGILVLISVATVALIFYSDYKGITYPLLEAVYKPIVAITAIPALLLAFGHVIAKGKKEEKISSVSFGRSAIIVLALFTFRWMTGYFD